MMTPGKTLLLTKNTLEIALNPGGAIGISGRAMDGYLTSFFNQVEDWTDSYICNPADLTTINFSLEYSTRSNTTILIHWIKKITKILQLNKKLVINWYYEEGDEDILEQGEHISSVVGITFNFIEISDSLLSEYDMLKWNHSQNLSVGLRYKHGMAI